MAKVFSIGANNVRALSKALEVTSDNLAGASVNGYKAKTFLFSEYLASAQQPDQPGRLEPVQSAGYIRRDFSSGPVVATTSPLDLAVTGNGFFTVGMLKTIDPEKTYYTRAGNFLMDREGFVTTASGLYLYGYQPTADGKGIDTASVGPLRVPLSMAARQTSEVFLDLTLPNNMVLNSNPFNPDSSNDLGVRRTEFALFDSVGQEHKVNLDIKRVGLNLYDVYVNIDGQRFASRDSNGTGQVQMPDSGTAPQGIPDPVARFGFRDNKLVAVGDPRTLDATTLANVSGTPSDLKLNIKVTPPESGKVPLNPALVFPNSVEFSLDFAGTTLSNASSIIKDSESQNGYSAAGLFDGISFDDNGICSVTFSNKQSLVAGQCQLSMFTSVGGLQSVLNNTFKATSLSGPPIPSTPSKGSFGSIKGGEIEQSNVKVVDELLQLIVLQRLYEANGQAIRTESEFQKTAIDSTR